MKHSITNEVQTSQTYINELKEKIADLNNQLPKHSIPPAMIMELENLEEELATALKTVEIKNNSNA